MSTPIDDLAVAVHTIKQQGTIEHVSVSVRDDTRSYEYNELGSITPKLVYNARTIEYTITIRMRPNANQT